jgi:hypothetical protein
MKLGRDAISIRNQMAFDQTPGLHGPHRHVFPNMSHDQVFGTARFIG